VEIGKKNIQHFGSDDEESGKATSIIRRSTELSTRSLKIAESTLGF
jgi:hypothetical protein